MSFLQNILREKELEVAHRKRAHPFEQLKGGRGYHEERRSLIGALEGTNFGIIAEIKKASPSRGLIRPDFDPERIAGQYAFGGAIALSVLTDEKFFQGGLSDLSMVRGVSTLPLLRKDFVLDTYQLHESKAAGADAVLLIAAALDPQKCADLHQEATELGLDVLLEVHNEADLTVALASGPKLLGINNRDLHTFNVDLDTTLSLARRVPEGILCISESGISTGHDLRRLIDAGCRGALIGEFFMKQKDPGAALRDLLNDIQRGDV